MNKKTKVLILEDNEERITQFRLRLEHKKVDLTFARTALACIRALEQETWDYLFLDHDLGGHVYVPSDGEEKTGWHVAKWITHNISKKPDIIIIHSLNENGRKNIKSLLPHAFEMPFAWETISINEENT